MKAISITLTTTLILIMSSGSPSFSQDIEEVKVTATKTEKNIEDIGASVYAIRGEDLNQIDFGEELAQHISGVQAAVANGSQVAFQIRGIGAVDHQALTPTAAAIYRDGVYLATNVQTSPLLFDLERAEVLKGPQGSLYGRNASAGAINFISIKPGSVDEGYVEGEYGRFNRLNFKGAFNKVFGDKMALRLSGRYLSQDPALKNIKTNDLISAPANAGGKRDEFGLKALANIKASDQTDILFNLHYAEDNGINAAPLNSSLTALENHEISIGPDGVQDTDNEFYGTSIEINHKMGEYTLFILGAFEGYNQQYGFDFDGTPAPFGVPTLNANLAYDRDFSQYSLETRLSHEGDASELMLGAYLDAEDFEQEYLIWCGNLDSATLIGSCTYVGAPGRVGPTPTSTGTVRSLQSLIEQTRTTAAIFTHNSFDVTQKLEAIVGARFTHETIKGNGEGRHIFDDGIVGLNNRDDLGLAVGNNEIKENRLTGNVGLNYHITDTKMGYVSFSSGYKSGGFNGEVINNATHFSDEGLFEAETVKAFELGLKGTTDALRYNLALFYQDYEKPQARIFVPFATEGGGSFTSNSLSNLEEATSKGLEFDLTWSLMEGLDLGGSFTYLDTEISQTANPDVPQNAELFDGNPLPFASEYSGTLHFQYQWAPNPNIQASLKANAKFQSEFYLDAEGRDDRKQDGYGLIDASLNLYFKEGVNLSLWGRNLTNKSYAISGFGFIGYNRFLGAPRSYGLALRYNF